MQLYGLDKLSVLNGGLTHWESLGYRTETGPAKPQKVSIGSIVYLLCKEEERGCP